MNGEKTAYSHSEDSVWTHLYLVIYTDGQCSLMRLNAIPHIQDLRAIKVTQALSLFQFLEKHHFPKQSPLIQRIKLCKCTQTCPLVAKTTGKPVLL